MVVVNDCALKKIQVSFICLLNIDVFNSNILYRQNRRGHDLSHYTPGILLFYSPEQPRYHSFCLVPKMNSSCTTEVSCGSRLAFSHYTCNEN